MKKMREMCGFWATLGIAAATVGCMLSIIYLSPSKSLVGFLASLAAVVIFLLVANLIINFLYRDEKKEDDGKLSGFYSSESLAAGDELESELDSLVSEIAQANARKSGKFVTMTEAEAGLAKGKLISTEDMEAAFLEAVKLVSSKCASPACPCKTNCDNQPLLQKIRNIRKNFEKKSQTP